MSRKNENVQDVAKMRNWSLNKWQINDDKTDKIWNGNDRWFSSVLLIFPFSAILTEGKKFI